MRTGDILSYVHRIALGGTYPEEGSFKVLHVLSSVSGPGFIVEVQDTALKSIFTAYAYPKYCYETI